MGLMQEVMIAVEQIYVPAKRRREVDPARVEAIAESIIEGGLSKPLQVRMDPQKNRYVLVAGLQRLEALKALGETQARCLVVRARTR